MRRENSTLPAAQISSILERMLGAGIFTGLDFLDVSCDRTLDAAAIAQKILYELCFFARVDIEHVVQHEHLPRAVAAGADADRRYAKLLRDRARKRGRDQLEHDHAGSRVLDQLGFADQPLRLGFGLALHPVSA